MAESRNAPRATTKHQGKVVVGGRTDIECQIKDLSSTGAKISFSNPTFLPKVFTLKFDGEEHRVTVKWQRGLQAGVRFQTPIRSPVQKKRGLLAWATG
jgi:hypothetical protein